jgi:hypothetical protein
VRGAAVLAAREAAGAVSKKNFSSNSAFQPSCRLSTIEQTRSRPIRYGGSGRPERCSTIVVSKGTIMKPGTKDRVEGKLHEIKGNAKC